jgi:hypothetical protein
MTAPTAKLTVTERERLKALTFEKSGAVPPGRVMLCKGRKVVGYCNVAELSRTFIIAAQANTVCLSAEDFADVQEWLG